LVQHGREQALLVLDAGQVGGGARVPVPGVRQGGDAADVVRPRGQVQPAVRVVDRERQADVHPAQGVDDLDEAEEVDLDEVVDSQPGVGLNRLHHELRPAQAVGRVDLVHAVAWDVHPGVPGHADHGDVTAVRGYVDQHQGVGVRAHVVAHVQREFLVPGQPGAYVHPGQQYVQRAARRGAGGAREDPADAVIDVAGEPPGRPGDEEHHYGHGGGQHEKGAPLPGL